MQGKEYAITAAIKSLKGMQWLKKTHTLAAGLVHLTGDLVLLVNAQYVPKGLADRYIHQLRL